MNVDPPRRRTPEECRINWDAMITCFEGTTKTTEDNDTTTPAIPEITLTDLATFTPDPGTLTAEPDNIGVAGLPTNFTTQTGTHTQTGTLFGHPLTVRFTPTTYTFHHGDNTTTTTHTPGTTWATLHQAQFTPTPTSHTYTTRGTYTAHVDITYTADIDLGIGWYPITGHLTIPGTPQNIRIYQAHTALVAHTCNEQPHAPGC